MGLETGTVVALLGTAASLAGTGVSVAAARSAQNRANAQLRNALATQEGFQSRASPLLTQSLEKSTLPSVLQQLDTGEREAETLYRGIQGLPLGVNALPVNTGTESAIQQANKAAAGVAGFGNFSLQQWLKNMETNSQLGVLSNLSQGAASVVPWQLQAAKDSTADMAALGSLLSSAGALGTAYGQQKEPKPNYEKAD